MTEKRDNETSQDDCACCHDHEEHEGHHHHEPSRARGLLAILLWLFLGACLATIVTKTLSGHHPHAHGVEHNHHEEHHHE